MTVKELKRYKPVPNVCWGQFQELVRQGLVKTIGLGSKNPWTHESVSGQMRSKEVKWAWSDA